MTTPPLDPAEVRNDDTLLDLLARREPVSGPDSDPIVDWLADLAQAADAASALPSAMRGSAMGNLTLVSDHATPRRHVPTRTRRRGHHVALALAGAAAAAAIGVFASAGPLAPPTVTASPQAQTVLVAQLISQAELLIHPILGRPTQADLDNARSKLDEAQRQLDQNGGQGQQGQANDLRQQLQQTRQQLDQAQQQQQQDQQGQSPQAPQPGQSQQPQQSQRNQQPQQQPAPPQQQQQPSQQQPGTQEQDQNGNQSSTPH